MIVSLLTLGNLVPLEIFVLWPDCEVLYREWNNASVGYSWIDQELSILENTNFQQYEETCSKGSSYLIRDREVQALVLKV